MLKIYDQRMTMARLERADLLGLVPKQFASFREHNSPSMPKGHYSACLLKQTNVIDKLQIGRGLCKTFFRHVEYIGGLNLSITSIARRLRLNQRGICIIDYIGVSKMVKTYFKECESF